MEELALLQRDLRLRRLEEAEDRRAASRHRGIEGPGPQKPPLELADGGMCREDGGLEVVGYRPLPLRHGTPQPFRKRTFRYAGAHPGVGFAGRDPLRGLHHDECQTLQKQVEGLHHLSAARTQLGHVAHEEGRVAAQLGGAVDQLRLRKPQVEERVDRPQHGRAVG